MVYKGKSIKLFIPLYFIIYKKIKKKTIDTIINKLEQKIQEYTTKMNNIQDAIKQL